MSAALRGSRAARRAAALLVLALLLALASPLVAAPVLGWLEGRQAVAEERRVLDRLARLEARRAAVAGLAAGGDPPFLVAADIEGARAALEARLALAAPVGAVRLDALELAGTEEEARPGVPVRLRVQLTATPAGLFAFVRDLETRPPFVRVDALSAALASDPKTGAPGVVSASAEVSAVPLIRGAPPT